MFLQRIDTTQAKKEAKKRKLDARSPACRLPSAGSQRLLQKRWSAYRTIDDVIYIFQEELKTGAKAGKKSKPKKARLKKAKKSKKCPERELKY